MLAEVLMSMLWDDRIARRPTQQEEIRIKAYYAWINAGRPEGKAIDHWVWAKHTKTAELAHMMWQRFPKTHPDQCWQEAERFLSYPQ